MPHESYMFAAARYNQKFIDITKNDYDACPNFGQVYLEVAARSTHRGRTGTRARSRDYGPETNPAHPSANMEGGRSQNCKLAGGAGPKGSSRAATATHKELSSEAAKRDQRSQNKVSSSKVPKGDYFIWKNLLYLRDPITGLERLCVPDTERTPGASTLRQALVSAIHDNVMAIHLGSARTAIELKKRAYWPRMDRDVNAHVLQCEDCQRNKAGSRVKAT